MTITALVPVAEPRTPGYGRAFGRVTVFGAAYGRTVPLAGALVRPYVPGTSTPWPDPLYLDEADATAAVFPVATDASGAVALWADAQGRVELVCEATGYEAQRLVLDLEPAPAAAPPPTDLSDYYTKSEADSAFLSESEADGLYLPLDYVPPASGISQADADLRYVNTAGDTMTGALTVNGNVSTFGHLYTAEGNVYATSAGSASVHVSSPTGGYRSVSLETSGSPRWFLAASYEPETGSNAGSNLWLNRMDDAGGTLGTALTLSRATGAATFGGAVTVPSLTVAALPVAVSPDASNALEWRANGFYATAGGAGSYLPLTGGTLTGALVLQGASSTTNVLQAKLAADANPRFRFDAAGKLEWGDGTATPGVSIERTSTSLFLTVSQFAPATPGSGTLGATGRTWASVWAQNITVQNNSGSLDVGASTVATAGGVRLRNAMLVGWRNAANSANLSLGMNASDHLELTVAAGALTTTVGAAGGASALPATPTGYITLTLNGTARKIPYYAT